MGLLRLMFRVVGLLVVWRRISLGFSSVALMVVWFDLLSILCACGWVFADCYLVYGVLIVLLSS